MPPLRRRRRRRPAPAALRASAGVSLVSTLRAPALERVEGDAGARGRGVERPAEMLAGMLEADAQAVMREHLVVERGDQRKLRGERRRGFAPAGFEIARDLARAATAGPAPRGRP